MNVFFCKTARNFCSFFSHGRKAIGHLFWHLIQLFVFLRTRLAALQKSGDTEWRKRISKPAGCSSPSSATEGDEAANSDGDIPTKSSIADRLKVLETAQKGWQKRVLEPDAARFTVAGKMGQRPASVHVLSSELIKPISPLLDRKKKAPKPVPLRLKASEGSDSSPGTPSTDDAKPPFNRSTSDPNGTPSKSTVRRNRSRWWFQLLNFYTFWQRRDRLSKLAKLPRESWPSRDLMTKRSRRSSPLPAGRWPPRPLNPSLRSCLPRHSAT